MSATARSISRRSFLKTTVAATAGVAAAGSGSLTALAQYDEGQSPDEGEHLAHCVCRPNCFGFCNINVHVRDGKAVKTSRYILDNAPHYSRICQRGLSHVERIYAAGRLQDPLRRVPGTERGAGEWEKISWDEALDEIAGKITEIQEKYGPQAVAFSRVSGNYGMLVSNTYDRFVNVMNCSTVAPVNDLALFLGQSRLMGTGVDCNEITDVVNAKTIVVYGANVTDSQVHHWHFIKEAMKNGTKLVVIDPVFNTIASKADLWVPIRPGSDQLLYWGIMKIILERGAVDERYMRDETVGPFLVREDTGTFLRKSFVDETLGADGDGVGESSAEDDAVQSATGQFASLGEAVPGDVDPYMVLTADGKVAMYKDEPAPALEGEIVVGGVKCRTAFSLLRERIEDVDMDYCIRKTDLSREIFDQLADICIDGPVYHLLGYGAINQIGGVQTVTTGLLMSCLTGNWGKPGATFGSSYPALLTIDWNWPYVSVNESPVIQDVDLKNVIRTGQFAGEECTIKMLWYYCGNNVCTSPDCNTYTEEVFPAMDYIVVADSVMTDTARYADLVLPVAQHFEYVDVTGDGPQFATAINEKAIDPPFNAKPDFEIIKELANRLGCGEYFDFTDEEACKQIFETDYARMSGLTWERLKEEKYIRWAGEETYIAHPQGEPFPTTSGRLEFYCENPMPRAVNTMEITPEMYAAERLPRWVPPQESWDNEDGRERKYPIVMLSVRGRFRVHSQYHSVGMLNEIDPEPKVYLNPKDCLERGIADGDYVEAYNDRGHAVAKAVYSEGVRPGTLLYPKGWQKSQHKAGSWSELLYGEFEPFSVANQFMDSACDIRVWNQGGEE